ncbi:MAG: prolyl oligopeptidase family serine peptidase [Terrimonas sp.]|nr:prolyl oligopeptidase family serine peptidase [Terrimonas sp.]
MKYIFLPVLLFSALIVFSQKKQLDHTVYDHWQSIGEKQISHNGQWVVYSIDVQEGDNELVIQRADTSFKMIVPRGYQATITDDNRFVIFLIKPLYKDTREARIKKKKPAEFPKDSLGILDLGTLSLWKRAAVSGYKIPEHTKGWMAYLNGNSQPDTKEGAELVVHNLTSGNELNFKNIAAYLFDRNGKKILLYQVKTAKDSSSQSAVLYYDMSLYVTDTLSRGGADFCNFSISEDGLQVAYTAQRDSSDKALQQFYKLWYYREGMDSAMLVVDYNNVGMQLGMTVSQYGATSFSKSGKRLFFGTAPIQPPIDTLTPEIDKVNVDIWHYADDDLQTVQLARLQKDLKKNFLSVYELETGLVQQLAKPEIPVVYPSGEGDGDIFTGIADQNYRLESQWTGAAKKDIYAIDLVRGTRKLVKKALDGIINASYCSPSGKFILWYDFKARNYFLYDGKQTHAISTGIKFPLYEEENDMPADARPYGLMGWEKGDSAVYVYDRYDIWKLVPGSKEAPRRVLSGRDKKVVFRYLQTDPEEKYIDPDKPLTFLTFHETSKSYGLWEAFFSVTKNNICCLSPIVLDDISLSGEPLKTGVPPASVVQSIKLANLIRAKDRAIFLYTKESFSKSPDLYVGQKWSSGMLSSGDSVLSHPNETRLSHINPQQDEYYWGTAELFTWKAYDGKNATGILYKPENFDPRKKYPMICYFYEQLSNTLHNYYPPAPIRSAINIPFYTSRGYVIFVPDIRYKIGYPGQSAYNYVVSGARAVVKKGFVDSTRMAIQGHSWGGYQVAFLITRTSLFKAAWAGAPVANMTSAYGGIRWESGLNRQFQYEKTQSRIGATLWEKRNLYIENSPLFFLDKVKTPVVIMHNDGDGAVPWYQGIEMFTGLRRLGKKVWMLNYNGEGHGLTVRKDKLDYQVRMQQFFDWILKGEQPAKWILEGVPATEKGKDRGLELME